MTTQVHKQGWCPWAGVHWAGDQQILLKSALAANWAYNWSPKKFDTAFDRIIKMMSNAMPKSSGDQCLSKFAANLRFNKLALHQPHGHQPHALMNLRGVWSEGDPLLSAAGSEGS
jgi:hypothetical protein